MKISNLDKFSEQELMPFKLLRDRRNGDIYQKYENDEFYSLVSARLFLNGKIWMPEINVGVVDKTTKKRVLSKGVYMSKRDYEESYNKFRTQLDILDDKLIEKEMFKEYIKFHRDKYQKQMSLIFKEAKKEVEEKAKHETPETESGMILGTNIDKLKDFIENPNMDNVHLLWEDIKDKGYIRVAKRGKDKGLLIPDMKAINRIVLSREFMEKPSTISALIAKEASDELKRWSRWGISWSLHMDIGWWSDEMSSLMGIAKDNYDAKSEFRKKVTAAIDYYKKFVVGIVNEMNNKILIERKEHEKEMSEEPKGELPEPNIIEVSED